VGDVRVVRGGGGGDAAAVGVAGGGAGALAVVGGWGLLVVLAALHLSGPVGRWLYTRRSWRAIGAHPDFAVAEPAGGSLDEPSSATDVDGRRVLVVVTPDEWVLPQPNRVVVEAPLSERGMPWLAVRSRGGRDRRAWDVETGDGAFDRRFGCRRATGRSRGRC
jgi:hypothetical protein